MFFKLDANVISRTHAGRVVLVLILLGCQLTRVALVVGLGVTNSFELFLQAIEFFIRERFQIDQVRPCSFYTSEQLIEFQMESFRIAVLRVLD
jgi:hypothetical protein